MKRLLSKASIFGSAHIYSCGNRTWKLVEIQRDRPSYNREPVGLSDQEPARNFTIVWLCSRHESWSGTSQATRPFSGCFLGGVLTSIKVSLNLQLDSSPLYSSSIFRTLLCFLARIRFCSRIRSSSSIILTFKTRIRSIHKNEK